MKALCTIILFLVVGCSSNKVEIDSYEKVDSIIQSNQTSIVKTDSINQRSEKIITKKVTKAIDKIQKLENEVVETKKALEYSKKNPVIIKVIDTVYIEKKKNFWGREKTAVTTKSDSTIVQDSTENK